MKVSIPPPQPSDVTYDVHVTQVNMNVNIPTPQPSDVTSDVRATQVNMNVNIPTPQPSDVTSDVHVTQVNMNVNIPTPPTQVGLWALLEATWGSLGPLGLTHLASTWGPLQVGSTCGLLGVHLRSTWSTWGPLGRCCADVQKANYT